MSEVQKSMQIAPEVRTYHAFIVPLPDRFARTCFDCARPNISRNTPFAKMKIRDPPVLAKDCCKLPLLSSGRYMLTGLYRISNTHWTPALKRYQTNHSFFGPHTNREKIRSLGQSRIIP